MTQVFVDDVTTCIPRLSHFARRLAGNATEADDLVQETVLRALVHEQQFERGSNLIAWLTTILRNCYFNTKRQSSRLTSLDDPDGLPFQTVNKPQDIKLQLNEVLAGIEGLPAVQRQALALVAVDGHSYETAAEIAGCAVGTMKSRVSRARTELENQSEGTTKPSARLHLRDFDHLERAA